MVLSICRTEAATINAASASQSDVASAINAASDGDTVIVPSGSGSWSGLSIAKAITLQGAGTNATVITLTGNNSITKDNGGATRVRGFRFIKSGGGNSSKGWTIGGSWLSADPVIFQTNHFDVSGSGLFLLDVPGGVIFSRCRFVGAWDDSFIQPKAQDGQNSWSTADTFGDRDTDGKRNHYVEDCDFYGGTNQGIDADDNTRVVYRYNILMYSSFNTHGWATSPAGVRHWEVYGNRFDHAGGTSAIANQNWSVWIRGGTGFIYSNYFANIAGSEWGDKGEVKFTIRGAEDSRPQGACGSVKYPVPRQLGQSHDGTSYTTDPIRWYGNTGTMAITAGWNWGNPCGLTFSDFWQQNRDYVIGTPKSGYAPYTYPHPLVSGSTPVQNSPVIVSNPQSAVRLQGESVSFTVSVNGSTPLSYQWQKNQANIPGATAATYTIASVQTNDAGNYRCVVTNAYGSATSAAAALTVNVPTPVPASITAQPQSLSRTVGQSATFTVTAAGDAPLVYQWQKNGVNLAGANAASYSIVSVQTNDAGNFRCVVTNAYGSATSAVATLTVTVPLPEPASVVTHPQSLTRTVGQSATFSLVAAGTAPLTYQWQKNGLNLAGAVAASFTIASVQTNDAGSFRCLVSNALGSATSSVATLTVNPAAAGNVRYVDFVSGNDSNPGTAASPWRRCPGMVGWSGSATLQPGDTVYFNLARTWDLGANSSGPGLDLKAGVQYIGNQWDPQGVGTGRAVLRATGRHEAGVVRFWEDHATLPTWLQGFEINANGQRANLIDINHSFWKTGLTKAVKRIEDCVAHSNSGNGSEGDYKYGIIISDNSSDASGWVANVEILNTVVFNVPRDAICLYPGNNGMISNIVVRGCEVYSTGTDPSYSEGHGLMFKGNVKNSVFEFNYAHDVNSSAVFINGPESGSGPGPSGCVARYNILQTADNNGVIRYYGTGSKSVDIIGNLVLPNEDTGGLSFSGNSGAITARIYNNTFYNSYVNLGNPTSTGTIEFRNNIIYELDDVPLTDSGSDITGHSHNLFYRANSGARAQIGGTSYTTTSITSWEPTARTTDPLFKNPANLPTGFILTVGGTLVPNTDGLSLQEGSPALGVGADLGATFSGSINGTARAAGTAWDLGAYQRVAGAAPPSPPRNLAVIP
ncbi:MAG: immunoglobulin domain-containing protein [Verrucomicrobia bacterium]|nr:immunoglobulin domain-containing protein [Verrucomicrobiota bacterium]